MDVVLFSGSTLLFNATTAFKHSFAQRLASENLRVVYFGTAANSLCIILSTSDLDVPVPHSRTEQQKTKSKTYLNLSLDLISKKYMICCAFDAARPFYAHRKKIFLVIITVIGDWLRVSEIYCHSGN